MELIRVESILIYLLSFILAIEYMFVPNLLLTPLALAILVSYLLFVLTNSYQLVFSLFPLILLGLYFYKLNSFAKKLRTSEEGYVNFKVFHRFLDKLQPSEQVYKRLLGQYGYVVKNFHDGSYLVRFNIGAFGRNKFTCYSKEPLERGDRVLIKALEDGKLFIKKSKS